MTTTRTPGSWHTEPDPDDGGVSRRYVVSEDGVLIADCYADSPHDLGLPSVAEVKGNAAILAAAPALEKSLKDLSERLEKLLVASDAIVSQPDLREALAEARAALAKVQP